MRNLLFFSFGLILAVFSGLATSATFSPQSVMNVTRTTAGATASTKFAAMTASNQAVYAMRAVQIPKSAIVTASKIRMFSPWGIAMTVAMAAAGYVVDDLTQTITDGSGMVNHVGDGKCYSWIYPINTNTVTASECLALVQSYSSAVYYTTLDGNFYYILYASGDARAYFEIKNGSTPPQGDLPYVDSQPISDNAYYDWLQDSPYYSQTFESPMSGQPNPDIQQFQDAADDVTADYTAENDGDPATVPTTDPETGDTGAEDITEEEPEDKDPCIKNPALLMCIEMDDVPDETDVIQQEFSTTYSPVSFSSNASCPSDMNGPHGVVYSFDFPCQLATGISPIIILMAILGGLYIISGSRRED